MESSLLCVPNKSGEEVTLADAFPRTFLSRHEIWTLYGNYFTSSIWGGSGCTAKQADCVHRQKAPDSHSQRCSFFPTTFTKQTAYDPSDSRGKSPWQLAPPACIQAKIETNSASFWTLSLSRFLHTTWHPVQAFINDFRCMFYIWHWNQIKHGFVLQVATVNEPCVHFRTSNDCAGLHVCVCVSVCQPLSQRASHHTLWTF